MQTTRIALLLLTLAAAPDEAPDSKRYRVDFPGKTWCLELDMKGFRIEGSELRRDGQGRRVGAAHEEAGLNLTLFLEKAAKDGDEKACRAYYWAKLKQSPMPESDVRQWEKPGIALLEYFLEIGDGALRQRHVHAFLAKDGVWIDVHLSKMGYREADAASFEAVLSTLRFREPHTPNAGDPPDSQVLFAYGADAYYEKRDHARAARLFQQALDLETRNRRMDRKGWCVLVDTLGLARVFSGDVEAARKTWEAGLSKEPEFPFFHYNLACYWAETGDARKACEALRAAKKHKDRGYEGGRLPDPRKDSSFKALRDRAEFKRIVRDWPTD